MGVTEPESPLAQGGLLKEELREEMQATAS